PPGQPDLRVAGDDRARRDHPRNAFQRRRPRIDDRGRRPRRRERDLSPGRRRGERPVGRPDLGRLAGRARPRRSQEGRQGNGERAVGNLDADHQGGQIDTRASVAAAAGAPRINPEAIADRTTVGVFFRQAARYGDRALVHFQSGDQWKVHSWNDAQRNVLAVASGLIDAGVRAGDSVILISENRVEWICCDWAIQSIGAITVPIYPNSPPEMAQTIAVDCAATFAIASSATLAAKLKVEGPLRKIALMDSEVAGWMKDAPRQLAEIASRLKKLTPDDLCTIVYTAGKTGVPKGVPLAHRNLVDVSRAAVKVHPITDQDSSLPWLPYAHVYGRINEIFVGIVYGGQTWISLGPDHLAKELQDVTPTLMCSVPRVYEKIYAAVMARVDEASPVRRALFKWAIRIGASFSRASHPGPTLRSQRGLAERLVLGALRTRLTGGRLG